MPCAGGREGGRARELPPSPLHTPALTLTHLTQLTPRCTRRHCLRRQRRRPPVQAGGHCPGGLAGVAGGGARHRGAALQRQAVGGWVAAPFDMYMRLHLPAAMAADQCCPSPPLCSHSRSTPPPALPHAPAAAGSTLLAAAPATSCPTTSSRSSTCACGRPRAAAGAASRRRQAHTYTCVLGRRPADPLHVTTFNPPPLCLHTLPPPPDAYPRMTPLPPYLPMYSSLSR